MTGIAAYPATLWRPVKAWAAEKAGRAVVKGVTQRGFTVKVLDDRRVERTESVLLTLTRPSRRALLGTPNVAVLRIKDNDR